jgi:pyrroloquinoline quinone (PQQ) biosynthesis protein C
MASTSKGKQPLSAGEFIELMEQTRSEFLEGKSPFRGDNITGRSVEQIADSKRKFHTGGDPNHRFEWERYLNTTHREIRRKQLRKLVDEGGQDTVGGPMASHPHLARWHSNEFGISNDEIDQLEMKDADPETLVKEGWWFDVNRSSPWPVAIASCMVGEGSKRLPGSVEHYENVVATARREFAKLGIKNIDRAVQLIIEHAPFGADMEHARFGEEVIRTAVNTTELQEGSLKAFILTMQRNTRGRV